MLDPEYRKMVEELINQQVYLHMEVLQEFFFILNEFIVGKIKILPKKI